MARISIDVEANNHKQIKMAAMLHDKSMMDYIKDIVVEKAREDLMAGISEPNALTKQIMDNTHNNNISDSFHDAITP